MNGMKINAANAEEYYRQGFWTKDTLLDRWQKTVAACGEKEFVCDDLGRHYTYSRMDALADSVAAYLEERGVAPGDVVTFQITPRCEFVAVLFGCIKLGAVPAPLGMCFEGSELSDLLKRLGSRLHISIAEYRGKDRSGELVALKALPGIKAVAALGSVAGADSLEEILASNKKPRQLSPAGSDDLALILCTSGTTKGSKAVMFTHNCVIFSEETFNRAYSLTASDCMFMPAPLNHATGLHHGIISPMLRGGRLVLQERFKCREAAELMNREGCTYSMGATPFIYDLLKLMDEEGVKIPTLRFYISGGAPVPQALVQSAHKNHGLLVCECYGSTESVPHTGVRPEECLEKDGSGAGRAMDGIEVRIVDKNRRPLPVGEVGEEASRGPNMFVGYMNDSEETNRALDDDGWFYSGDLAVMEPDGSIKIVGRIKDIIVRGGENLNSNLISDNLEGCPGVADHSVIGMPDERLGERICAFITLSEGTKSVTKQDIIEYLKSRHVQKRLWPERGLGKARKKAASARLFPLRRLRRNTLRLYRQGQGTPLLRQ